MLSKKIRSLTLMLLFMVITSAAAAQVSKQLKVGGLLGGETIICDRKEQLGDILSAGILEGFWGWRGRFRSYRLMPNSRGFPACGFQELGGLFIVRQVAQYDDVEFFKPGVLTTIYVIEVKDWDGIPYFVTTDVPIEKQERDI